MILTIAFLSFLGGAVAGIYATRRYYRDQIEYYDRLREVEDLEDDLEEETGEIFVLDREAGRVSWGDWGDHP